MSSRGLRLGLGLALLAALGLGLLDAGYAALLAPMGFEGPGERLWFFFLCALCLLAPAVVLGLLEGGLGLVVAALAARLSRSSSRTRTAPWIGRLCAVLFAPGVAAACAQVFRGPRAQRIPGHDLLALGLCLLALFLLSVAVPAFLHVLALIDESGPRRRPRALLGGGALALLGVALYLADRRVLPRLYPWFHLSLEALLLCVAQPAALLLVLPAGWLRRRWLNDEVFAVLLCVIALGAGAWGLLRLERAAVLRAGAVEHTALISRVLWLQARLGHGGEGPGAAPEAADEPAPPVSGPSLPGRDVFLITVDALRDDRVNDRVMPFTAALCRSGVRFARAYTQVPHTSFAVATLLTGKPVYALMALGQDAAGHETLATILRRDRYKTAAFYPPSVFFIEHDRLQRLEESAYGFEYVKFEYLDAPRRTRQVLDFLAAEAPARTLAWVHYLEPHEPYDVHPGGPGPRAPDQERYDGEATFVDGEIRRLVEYLRAHRPGALVVVAADHGEEFGEHGGRYHGTTLYEEQVRVPLCFVELPGANGEPAPLLPPHVVGGAVGLIDVAPTILRLLDIAPSARMRGHDLSPWLGRGAINAPGWPVYAEIGRKTMVEWGGDKLICDLSTQSCAVYDLIADPGERRNLFDAQAERTRRLQGQLQRFLAEAGRFEHDHTVAADGGEGWVREALERGRLGDRAAAPGLVRVLAGPGGKARQDAAAALTQLCVAAIGDPASRSALEAAGARVALAVARDRSAAEDQEARRWAEIGLAALGEADAQRALVPILQGEDNGAQMRLAAAVALSAPAGQDKLDRVALWAAALPRVMGPGGVDDPDRLRPLILALGRSGDARALPALLSQLGAVRSRVDLVRAIGMLRQPRAERELERLLFHDPYVPVRAAAAEALGRLGGDAARAALLQARRREREAPVLAAIAAALGGPGKGTP